MLLDMKRRMPELGMDKRTVSVSMKMSEADYALLKKAADHLWPKALLTRSSIVLGLALIGAESVLPKRKEKKA
jgi:hypothetical protein